MKTLFSRWMLLAALVSIAPGFSAPVLADDPDVLTKALDLVHQTENSAGNPSSDARRIDLLTQAIKLAQQETNHRLKGHRVLAIQAIRAAIAEIRGGDPNHQAAVYLHTADAELSTSISLAGGTNTADAPQAEAPPQIAVKKHPDTAPVPATDSANLPPPHSQESPGNIVAATPPGVTTEMEQAFLAKYKAALEKHDPDAYMALVANDPHMDPKAREDMMGLELFGVAMTLSNPNRTYTFVPLTPSKEDKPIELAGKMYGGYLPPVIALKITFGKPAHSSADAPVAVGDTTLPLCIENHQLMLAGLKEIPGAVPPPAVDKSANFGFEPNLRKIGDKTEWENGNAFTSLNEFLASLKQPSVEILDSGEGKFEYYAICRISPNLCVWAGGDKVGERNYSFSFRATDSNKQELKGSQKWIRLVDVPTDNSQAPNVQGTVFFVPDHYTGLITIDAQYSDGAGNKTSSVSRTVEWK